MNLATALGKRQLVDSIWKSANIEGLGTTFPNTEAILNNLPVSTNREEVLFIVNMKRAWNFLFDNIDYPVDLSFLRELNKISMYELTYEEGQIRKFPVNIGGTSWIPEIPSEGIIIEKIKEINNLTDKLDASLEMFSYLARTQMFTDGNKRLAQLVTNKMLMENDIGILAVPVEEVKNFTMLLIDFYETNDNTYLKSFFLNKTLTLNPEYSISKELLSIKNKDYTELIDNFENRQQFHKQKLIKESIPLIDTDIRMKNIRKSMKENNNIQEIKRDH